ncbi:nucleoside-diphosphate kinase [Pseudolactococcus reticulitermitis]|uniref:Nucleoside diphosphate kinase-like domain-containing protein n=1 Tax=Pseudolactococcus reticulitermitis TaxID=2025039 RepID=A0A224XAA5_9LACT|nr:nucleoside-diphosphate kinase [Lactococcus reticulitermitis]GAX46882.1 hypothetical protein RsY01_462 [Lactococcus reticulitermitis]
MDKNLGFIIITNEAFSINAMEDILKKLSTLKIKKAILKLLPRIDESILIKHYREHLITWNEQTGKSVFPSIGWPAVRARFSKPLVVILLEGEEENICEKILSLKGPTNPELCNSKQLREMGINMTYNLVHSSDSLREVYRESQLYFSFKEIKNFLDSSGGKKFENIIHLLRELYNIQKKIPKQGYEIQEKIDLMLSWKLKEQKVLNNDLTYETKKVNLSNNKSIESKAKFLKDNAILWTDFDNDIYISSKIIEELSE